MDIDVGLFGVSDNSANTMRVEAALEWLAENTTLDTSDPAKLPAAARLFVSEFVEIMKRGVGVTSESMAGMQQSFRDKGGNSGLFFDLAQSLLGAYMKPTARVYPARNAWNDGD